MALPKEPRQKMINIMYLVLTAILALNVSSEILNAFKTIEDSFVKSSKELSIRSSKLISDFDDEGIRKQFPEKVAYWKPKAVQVKELSEKLAGQIEELKISLKTASNLKPDGTFNDEDLEATTRILAPNEDHSKEKQAKGEELYLLLEKYKSDLAKIDTSIASHINKLPVNLDIPKLYNKDNQSIVDRMNTTQEKWAYIYFHMTPTIAGLAILSKFQNDVRSSEAQLIDYCYSQVTSVRMSTTLAAIANASSTMVMTGDELIITAGLGAYNQDTKPSISIDGASVPLNADGQGVYKTIPSSAGDFTKHVTVTYKDPSSGEVKTKSTDVKYKVGIPTGLAFSVDSTKVFYSGIPDGNPISVSGAVGGAGAIKISIVAGSAKIEQKGPGRYVVFPNAEGILELNITDGKNSKNERIRVKGLPEPQAAYIVGSLKSPTSYGGVIGSSEFKLQSGLATKVPDDFIFSGIKYKIKSFKMQFSGKGFAGIETINIIGPSFGSAAGLMSKCTQGSQVLITDIVAEDAAKKDRRINNTISFFLK
jgi:hypothetical protein